MVSGSGWKINISRSPAELAGAPEPAQHVSLLPALVAGPVNLALGVASYHLFAPQVPWLTEAGETPCNLGLNERER